MQICRCIRGQGPPALSLLQVDHVPDETQVARYEREKEQRRQVARIQDDHQPRLLLSSPRTTKPTATTTATISTQARVQKPVDLQLRTRDPSGRPSGRVDAGQERQVDGSSTGGALPPRKLVTLASYTGRMAPVDDANNGNGNGDGFGFSLPPASLGKGKGCPVRRPVSLSRDADRARAVAAVPYPTLRSLRRS